MINSDMILEQSGLTNLAFEGIDYVNINKENGTAEAGIKVAQSEINQIFILKYYWKNKQMVIGKLLV